MLRLRGFKGIKQGMRKDEVVVDFRPFAHDATVAIVGANGKGKTTIVDNAHPYLTMPSRESEGGDFSYYGHITGDGAEKEFVFSLRGERYRQLLSFRVTGKTSTAEAFLMHWSNGQWVPFVNSEGIKSDGKISTYNRCIESLCGPSALYFTAIHQAQAKKGLYSLSNGDVKTLMASMFGADSIKKVGDRAKQTADRIGDTLVPARRRLAITLEALNVERPKLVADMAQTCEQQARVAAEVERSTVVLGQARMRLATAQVAVTQQSATLLRIQALQTELAGHNAQTQIETRQHTQAASAEASDAASRRSAISAQRTSDSSMLGTIEQSMARQVKLVDDAPRIVAAQTRLATLETELSVADVALAKAKQDLDAEMQRKQLLSVATAEINNKTEQWRAKSSELKNLTDQASTLERVPCAGSAMQGSCELLAIAREASRGIVAQQTVLHDLRQAGVQAREKQVELGKVDVAARKLQLSHAESSLSALAKEKLSLLALAAQAGQLEAATQELARLRVTQVELAARVVARGDELAALATATRQRSEALDSGLRDRLATIKGHVARLQQELDALGKDSPEARLQHETNALGAVQREFDSAESLARGLCDVAITMAVRHEQLEADYQLAQSELRGLDNAAVAQADYLLIAKAFGNDGIIALMLDEAGPELAAMCNELLRACYGPRFSVEIKTQIANKSGNLKEGFQVMVHDAEGDSRPVDDMSVGERVWINECMVKAIAIHLAKRSGFAYETCISDETDGALDDAKKRQFFAMNRKVMDLGGFVQSIFITHTKEISDMADARIDVEAL